MRKQRKINDFYVFYRISDSGTPNKVKLDYATKINCLKNAISVFKDAKIIVFIDNVIEDTDKKIHQLCDGLDNVKVEYLNCGGNSKSFRVVYDKALDLNDDDFVYLLEDDYLHLDNSFEIMYDFAERNYTDYVTLYDHPDKYEECKIGVNPYCKNMGEVTTLFMTQKRHWKITNSTTMTFGAFVDILRRDKECFWKYTNENIPKDFPLFLELKEGGKFLSSPIPSLSTHCNKGSIAPFVDWKKCINL